MNQMQGRYRVTFLGSSDIGTRELLSGRDFRLDEEGFSHALCAYLRPLDRDLLRIGTGIWVVDRLVRRYRRLNSRSLARRVAVEIEVSNPDFWNSEESLIAKAIRHVSDDFWTFRFTKATEAYVSLPLFPLVSENPLVCLYSGGLDSGSGLARRLRETSRPVLAITACHQAGQRKRVRQQLHALAKRYDRSITPVAIRTAMINPPRMNQQELSQRCRAFLFFALGGRGCFALWKRRCRGVRKRCRCIEPPANGWNGERWPCN